MPITGRTVIAATTLLSLTGVFTLLVMTRWGIGTSPDSVQYIRAARQLSGIDPSPSAPALSGQHAPLYPLLLAGGGWLGIEPLDGARWLNAVLFGLNIFLAGFIVCRFARHAPWLGIVASTLMLVSMPVLGVHAAALTEPLFLALVLCGCVLLAGYLEACGRRYLLGAAAAFGLAFMARYAGAACIVTGVAAVLCLAKAPLRRRARDAAIFGAAASLPMLAWIALMIAAGGGATNRELLFHPVGLSHAWQALYTASGWMLVPQAAPDVVRFALWLAVAGGITLLLLSRRRGRAPLPGIMVLLSLLIVVYGAFLAVSISFFDANTPLDDRILLPVFAAGLILVLHLADGLWPALVDRPVIARTALAVVMVFVTGHIVRGFEGISTSYASGWGFTNIAWQQSPTLARVRALPAGTLIYSNAPEIVYLHTGRTAPSIPKRRFLMNGRANPRFSTEMEAVSRRLSAECGVIVYFRGLTEQKSMPAERELRAIVPLRVLDETDDGAILGATACAR